MTGAPEDHVYHVMPLAVALHYDRLWWEDYNARRKLHAFDKVPEIYIVTATNDDEETASEVV